jgi:phosphatidate cytidylyltransferase
VAAGGLSLVYLGLPLGSLVGVHIFGGRTAVLLLVAAIAISDTAQYYSGRLLGRHALAPRLSPKKTIEGAAGGLVVVPLFLYFAGPYLVPVGAAWLLAVVGVVLVLAGIAGDLFESMMKRAADMKDSSALIPGHGGVLDRIDALLFAAPVFYLYLRWQYTSVGLAS